jgi:hypothetical protein
MTDRLSDIHMTKRPNISRHSASKTSLPTFSSGEEFDSLSNADKEKVWEHYNRKVPLSEMRRPTAAERSRMNRIRRKAGRPRVGQGSKVVAVTIEKGLLNRADAFAKEHALKRAELIARGLKMAIGELSPR